MNNLIKLIRQDLQYDLFHLKKQVACLFKLNHLGSNSKKRSDLIPMINHLHIFLSSVNHLQDDIQGSA